MAQLSRQHRRILQRMPYLSVENERLETPSSSLGYKRKMERLVLLLLSRLVLLLFVAGCFAIASSETAAQRRRPGFIYTRDRGRCTPQYWSSRQESWPRMVPQMSTVSNVFGSRAFERYRYDLSLLEATSRNDDAENVFAWLVKESTAALLNSYSRKGYPYSAWEVKTLVIQGLVSEESAALQAQQFREANEACG